MLFALQVGSIAAAQQNNRTVPLSSDGDARLEALRELHLPKLSDTIPTYYSPGFEKEARHTRDLLDGEFAFYESLTKTETPSVFLAVLSPADWAKPAQGLPYGMPSVSERLPFVVVMPADWHSVRALPFPRESEVNAQDLKTVLGAGTTWEEVQFMGGYGVATHEIGHALITQLKIETHVQWLNELLASYIGYAYLNRKHPEVMAGNELFWKYSLQVDHPHTDLAYFEAHPELAANSPLNYVWYQIAFDVQGLKVYRSMGVSFLEKVQAAFPAGAPTINTDQALDKLEAICPGWKKWAADVNAGRIAPEDIQVIGPIQ